MEKQLATPGNAPLRQVRGRVNPKHHQALTQYLREEARYQLGQGDQWTFDHYAGALAIQPDGGLVFCHPDGTADVSPNSLIKHLTGEKAGGRHYQKLQLRFRKPGACRAWRDLTDEFKNLACAEGEARDGAVHGNASEWRSDQEEADGGEAMHKSEINKAKAEKEAIDDKENAAQGGPIRRKHVRNHRSEQDIKAVFNRTRGRCYLCKGDLVFGNRAYGQPGAWHLEHVFSFTQRPDLDVLGNLLPAHAQCNLQKNALAIREAVTKHSNFSILSSVVQNEELLPEVQDVLKEAKELARRVRGFVVVCETLSGLAQVDLTFYPENSTLDRTPPLEDMKIKDTILMLRKLGDGSFGKVYLGLWRGRNVALKRSKVRKNERFIVNEANVLSALRHENLVRVHGWTEVKDDLCLVMEFVARGDLEQVLPEVDLLSVLLDVARGMAYLHSHNVLHRDLKPANILVTEGGVAKVADFGLAKLADPEKEDQTECGTQSFRAPEVRKGKYGLKVDVFSFGRIIQHLLGKPKRLHCEAEGALRDLAIECCGEPKLKAPLPEQRPTFATIVRRLEALIL